MTNILEVFDPATRNWTARAPMPTTRGGINGIAASDRFFVFGGEGPNGVFDEMEMYDFCRCWQQQVISPKLAASSTTSTARLTAD